MFERPLSTILSHRPMGFGIRNMLDRLTNSLDFHGQALSLRSERQRLIASNIASADTPGFVARDMDFSAALKQATGQQQAAAVTTTQAGHIGGQSINAAVENNMVYALPSQTNLDRNTVDMDRERANF